MKIGLNKRAMLIYIFIAMTGFCFAACKNNNKNKKAEQPVTNAIAEETITLLRNRPIMMSCSKTRTAKPYL